MSGRDTPLDLPQAGTADEYVCPGCPPGAAFGPGCELCMAPAASAAEPATQTPRRPGRKRLDDGPRSTSGKRITAPRAAVGPERIAGPAIPDFADAPVPRLIERPWESKRRRGTEPFTDGSRPCRTCFPSDGRPRRVDRCPRCERWVARQLAAGVAPADLHAQALRERLMRSVRIDDATGCWVWAGARTPYGHPRLHIGGKTCGAHRVMYELTTGVSLEGQFLDHLCCNPPCVNPAHLEPVTHDENLRRARERTGLLTHCRRGHPRTPENMIGGYRKCRACDDIMRAARKARWGEPRG